MLGFLRDKLLGPRSTIDIAKSGVAKRGFTKADCIRVNAGLRNDTPDHIRHAIREIDADHWIIGGHILLSWSSSRPEGQRSWSDGGEGYYSMREVEGGDGSRPNGASSGEHPFWKVRDSNGVTVVWRIGCAYLKAVLLDKLDFDPTREHLTTDAVRGMMSSSSSRVKVPEVLFHGEWHGRYYMVTSEAPGQMAALAWPSMTEEAKAELTIEVVGFMAELAEHTTAASDGLMLRGVDGKPLIEGCLMWGKDRSKVVTNEWGHRGYPSVLLSVPERVRKCEEIGMDCAVGHFSHCDLGPSNIMVDFADSSSSTIASVTVIDWEIAGYVPRAWIATKFRVGPGLDLLNDETTTPDADPEARHEWRRRVMKALEDLGGEERFPDRGLEFMQHLHADREALGLEKWKPEDDDG